MLFVLLDTSEWKTAGQRMGRLVFWEAIFIDVFLRPKPLRKDTLLGFGYWKPSKFGRFKIDTPTKSKKDMKAFQTR